MSVTYMTRQQQAVLACIESCSGGCATAAQLTELLHRQGQSVGLTTVYRQLEKLAQRGLVHKIVTDDGARYQYCPTHNDHFCCIIKCERCGQMEHVDCGHLGELYSHLAAEHQFRINARRTLFYGLCERCAQEGNV